MIEVDNVKETLIKENEELEKFIIRERTVTEIDLVVLRPVPHMQEYYEYFGKESIKQLKKYYDRDKKFKLSVEIQFLNEDDTPIFRKRLPDPEKDDKNITGYFERIKNDEKYKDVKELITGIQEKTKQIEEVKNEKYKSITINIMEVDERIPLSTGRPINVLNDFYNDKEWGKYTEEVDKIKLDHEKIGVNLSLTNIVAESTKKDRADINADDIKQTFPNYKFDEFELFTELIKLPDSKKSDKSIHGYFERVKQDEKYVDMKELITEIQKEVKKNKIELDPEKMKKKEQEKKESGFFRRIKQNLSFLTEENEKIR